MKPLEWKSFSWKLVELARLQQQRSVTSLCNNLATACNNKKKNTWPSFSKYGEALHTSSFSSATKSFTIWNPMHPHPNSNAKTNSFDGSTSFLRPKTQKQPKKQETHTHTHKRLKHHNTNHPQNNNKKWCPKPPNPPSTSKMQIVQNAKRPKNRITLCVCVKERERESVNSWLKIYTKLWVIKNHNTVDVDQQQQQRQNSRMPVNGIADLNRYWS